jgi:DNA-binding transcriptional regulator GbsR (MarR family)
MGNNVIEARTHFIQGMSRISNFWGLPRAMGAIYGAIYLSPTPLSLDEIVELVGVTKGAVSTNVRQLERLGMVHKRIQVGSRKDYYDAEIDFWKIVTGILRERETSEFDRALRTVNKSLEMVLQNEIQDQSTELTQFYSQRLKAMQDFFQAIDNLVAAILALEGLVSLRAIPSVLKKSIKNNK